MRWLCNALASAARWLGSPGRTRTRQPERQATRKYQTLLAPLPQSGDDAQTPALPWAPLRAVVRAPSHRTRGGQLLTALVTAQDETGQDEKTLPASSKVIATMVVVGLHPDECLSVGDTFTLWRGADIASGVITRRLFV